jgi:hypothetical protein
MNSSVHTNYTDSLDAVTYLPFPEEVATNLQGGYVEFSFLDQTYSHFFTSREELDFLLSYLQAGKPLEGFRAYIRNHYAPKVLQINLQEKEPIIIWNYELDHMVKA